LSVIEQYASQAKYFRLPFKNALTTRKHGESKSMPNIQRRRVEHRSAGDGLPAHSSLNRRVGITHKNEMACLDARWMFDPLRKSLLGARVEFRIIAELPLRRPTKVSLHRHDGFLVAAIQRIGWARWRRRIGRAAAAGVRARRNLAAGIALPASSRVTH
jgi:hypothetical protein